MNVYIPRENSKVTATVLMTSLARLGIGLPERPSARMKTSCPPSRAGKGSAFKTARLTDTILANEIRAAAADVPAASVNSEPALINEIGPPTSPTEKL
jgi:hypothetical protein